ncbi:uncharacterized protein LOC112504164 [Cynara cardunculus var. scolymus]|uniref:uncharacterized protein LOC112504164 n=1 Tax=Cynara cardunculus var. scolymus TaxID=59895 RepID=UPI000D62BA32|nr:uncharacterized protein LOC112504164 [Cynara cardunculus var. scolymus]
MCHKEGIRKTCKLEEEDSAEINEKTIEDLGDDTAPQDAAAFKLLENREQKNFTQSIISPPDLELKQLLSYLKYAFLGEEDKLLVIISSTLDSHQEKKLIDMLKLHTKAIGWTIADLKGISPSICQHKIILDDKNFKSIEPQRRLISVMKEMLDRLAGKEYYSFLDGYSGCNQIAISREDQENTTFTCPYGNFAFRRMPFGLCTAPATFRRCMMSIFSGMLEKSIEIFIDDFSVYGSNFDNCLENLK